MSPYLNLPAYRRDPGALQERVFTDRLQAYRVSLLPSRAVRGDVGVDGGSSGGDACMDLPSRVIHDRTRPGDICRRCIGSVCREGEYFLLTISFVNTSEHQVSYSPPHTNI